MYIHIYIYIQAIMYIYIYILVLGEISSSFVNSNWSHLTSKAKRWRILPDGVLRWLSPTASVPAFKEQIYVPSPFLAWLALVGNYNCYLPPFARTKPIHSSWQTGNIPRYEISLPYLPPFPPFSWHKIRSHHDQ